MPTAEEARQQIQVARAAIAEKSQEADRTRQQLEAAKKSLPDISSQQALRQKFAGRQGIIQRQNIEKAQTEIERRKGLVGEYKKELTDYEAQNIAPVEAQVSDLEERQRAIERVNRVADSEYELGLLAQYGSGYEQKYAEAYLRDINQAKEDFAKEVGTIQNSLPAGDKLLVDYKNLRIKGVASESASQSYDVQGYNAEVQKLNSKINDIPEIKQVVSDQSKMSREVRDIGFSSKITGFSVGGDLFPLVTAASKVPAKIKQSNVSGSPILNSSLLSGFLNKKVTETYSPITGMFVSASSTGERGTAILRKPTIEEAKKIDTITNPIEKFVFGDTRSGNILTANPYELRREIVRQSDVNQKISDIGSELDKIEKNNVNPVTNQWTGNQEEFAKYQRLQNQYNSQVAVLGSQTIGVGLFKQEQRPLSDFRYLGATNTISRVGSIPRSIGETAGANLGMVGALLPEEGVYKYQPSDFSISLPYQSRGTSFSKGDMFFVPTTEVKPSEVKFLTSEQGRAVGRFVGRASPYLNPYGEVIFGAETLGLVAGETEFTGGLGSGISSSFKKYPFEIGLAGGVGLFKIAKAGASATKSTLKSKYINEPELRVVNLQTKEVVNTFESQPRIRPKLEYAQIEDFTSLSLTKKQKGATQLTEITPSGTLTGSVEETRWLGKVRLSRKGIEKVYQSFVGNIEQGKGYLKETIDFGDVTRVTNIKDGVGKIELFRKGVQEPVKTYGITGSSIAQSLKTTKKEPLNFEVDVQTNNPLTIIEQGKNRVITNQAGDRVYLQGKPDLTAEAIQGQINIERSIGKGNNILVFKEEAYGFSDIAKTSERKGKVQLGLGDKSFELRKRQGQIIEVGKDTSKDVSKFEQSLDKRRAIKLISPIVNREIIEGSGTRVIQVTGKNKRFIESFKEKAPFGEPNYGFLKQVRENIDRPVDNSKIFNAKNKVTTSPITSTGGTTSSTSSLGSGFDNFALETSINIAPSSSFLKGSRSSAPDVINFGLNEPSGFVALLTRPKIKSSSGYVVTTNPAQEVLVAPAQVEVLDLTFNQKTDTTNTFRQNTFNRQLDNIKNVDLQRDVTRQEFRFDQTFKQEQRQRETPKQRERTTENPLQRKPKNPVVPYWGDNDLVKRIIKRAREEPSFFEAFTKVGGKVKSLGKFGSQEKAEKELFKVIKGIAASGKVTRNGQSLSLKELNLFKGSEFSPSKLGGGFFIQAKEKRLGTRKETGDIQYFKKARGSKKSRSIFG